MAEPIYSKLFFSNSVNGRQILISAIATPGTLIHTAVNSIVDKDEIWMYATNNHNAALNFGIEWGGVSSPQDLIQMSVPAKSGLYLVLPGLILNNQLNLRAFAETTNLLSVCGWVNRIAA